jgi:PAS domain S-box-containing protein
MQEKQRHIDEQISVRLQYWISKMLLLGIIFFPFIGIADYFLTPENLPRFMLYRLGITAVLAVAFYLNRVRRNSTFQYGLIALSTILSALVIEAMILQFGGHYSPYYAGMILLIIAALGLIPYGFRLSLSVGIAIYLIYLVPIFLFDRITFPEAFIVNNIFMICTFVLALSWRTLSQKSLINELSLHYDLMQDKSRLERAMGALNTSERWHRSLFENATDGIIVLDRNGVIVNANRSACAMHGYRKEDLVGSRMDVLEEERDAGLLKERTGRILSGEALVYETVNRKKDGTLFPVEVSAKTLVIGDDLFIHSFYRDSSEKKRMQEHLLQSQKLESIGVLAGGIAHDFNNTLAVILGNTEIVQTCEGLDARAVRCLGAIENASLKAGQMITKLLGFARKGTCEFVQLNVNEVVNDTVKMLERIVDNTIALTVELDGRVPQVQGDVNQIEQIIMNLVINARDAMPDRKGSIAVKTVFREITKDTLDVPPFVPPGAYVVLSITDTGMGIPERVRSTIFEPFFTTKQRGKGTGLGLSMVYGAVRKHNGYIDVQSTVGKGSAFTVFLPVPETAAAQPAIEPAALEGNETILVVDDEEEILYTMRDTLEHHGYTCIAVKAAPKALEVFREKRDELSLVITDIVMPQMDGKELIRNIKAIHPETRILAVSGYTNHVSGQAQLVQIDGFLKKPFGASSLLSTVRQILDDKSRNAVAAGIPCHTAHSDRSLP